MTAATLDTCHLNRWTAADASQGSAFRLRIVNVDHYLTKPSAAFDDLYSTFRNFETRRVPVIRVFGITDNGVKTCLHVHKVYPYLSIRYDSDCNEDNYELNKQNFMSRLVKELESRLMPNRVRTRTTTKDSTNDQIIYDIEEINAIPYYGYDNYKKFLRIYFYNPFVVQKVSELLLSGEIMGRQLQPFEAHIPYTLQFLIDNNLYGMNFLEANRVELRKTDSLPNGVLYSDLEPMSSCQLECDIDFKNIVNRSVNVNEGRLPGLEAIWDEELRRCKNSQEVLKLKGVASQERPDMPSTEMEEYWMKRLFDGLNKLNITLDINSNTSEEFNAEQVMDSSDHESNDCISQTIEHVINNSQSISINQTIEDVIINSQNNISQTIEDVVSESQKQKKHTKVKHNPKKGHNSRKRLNFTNSVVEGTSRGTRNINRETDTKEGVVSDETKSNENSLYVDAGTQTEPLNSCDDSMDSVFGLEEAIGDIICDCDSDECCDQCCDRGSDQCECDCERCEFEKCKRIPQMDGAFDSDDSDVDKDFSPKYKDDSDDSDYDVGSKKKKATPKKGAKRGRGKRSTPVKKSRAASDSEDDFADTYKSSPKRRTTARAKARKSPTPEKSDDDDIFQSSSGRKVKPSKNLSESLWDHFKPKDAKKRRNSGSPLRVSFSESDGSDKEPGFLSSFKDFSYTPTKNDDRSRRSLTPYLDEEPDEDKPSKTKPGPRSAKVAAGARPGPKSSKAAPAPASRPGPKSSKKAAKPGPKSSKRLSSLSSDDIEILETSTVSRSRGRGNAKSTIYDEPIETKKKAIPKGRGKRSGPKPKSKSEIQTAIDSLSEYITPDSDHDIYESPKKRSYSSFDCLATADLIWKSFNGNLVQIDANFYDMSVLDTIGNENLEVPQSPEYLIGLYKNVYMDNTDYWDEVKSDIEREKKGMKKAPTRSKGALKDFYTLPHLNEKRSPERAQKSVAKSSKSPERPVKAAAKPSKAKTAPAKASPAKKSTKKSSTNTEFARLISDASDIIDKPLGKRNSVKTQKQKAPKTTPKRVTPKSTPKSSAKSKPVRAAYKPVARPSRSRIPRGVTTSTVFNAINIPFYDSDIKVVTELTGARKVSYLKSLCDEFELDIQKLPKHYANSYRRNRSKQTLFDNMYYNDYSGILPDEQSQDTQDVLITVKNVINAVVSVSQCVDSVVTGVSNDLEPIPMIAPADEEEYDSEPVDDPEWHYEEETQEQEFFESGITENGIDDYEMMGAPAPAIEESDDPLSKALMKTFVDEEEGHDKEVVNDSVDQDENGDENHQNGDQDDDNQTAERQEEDDNRQEEEDDRQEDEDDDEGVAKDNEDEEPKSDNEENNENDEFNEEEREDGPDISYNYSPADQMDQYSNQNNDFNGQQNTANYQQPIEYDEEEDGEEDDQEDSSSSDPIINPSIDPSLKVQCSTSDCMYGLGDGPTLQSHQPIPYHHNPLQNPIVPSLPHHMPQHQFGQPTNIFPAQPHWPHHVPPQMAQYSSMPSIPGQPAQGDNEFDISNYNYMNYYPNNNIPQFDGIFDDDDFNTVGKPFNMRCSSDETIEQLSQGSRSEQASPKRHAADIVKEALLSGQSSGQRVDAPTTSASASVNVSGVERYGYSISGVVVKIPKSLPDRCLRQLGRELVLAERLNSNRLHFDSHYTDEEFSLEEQNSFFKTRLRGQQKFNYLQSLCKKKVIVCLNRLNTKDINSIKKPLNCVSSDFNKKFVLFENNKRLCIETNASTSAANSLSSQQMPEEVPESPLNITSNLDEVPESPVEEHSTRDPTNNGIYSFYLDESLSSNNDSQSEMECSQRSDHSLSEVPNSGSSQFETCAQHSTPMNSKKFKPFSQTLSTTQKAINLSSASPNSSNMFNVSEPLLFDEPIAGTSRATSHQPKHKYYRNDSMIEGPTPSTSYNFELSSVGPVNTQVDKDYECQYLTTMSVEIHVSTRAKLNPDPKTDAIEIIFYSIDIDGPPDPSQPLKYITGMIAVNPEIDAFECSTFNVVQRPSSRRPVVAPKGVKVDYTDDEIILLMKFVELVKHYDPDIIVGYKIDTLSWGYILERARILNMAILTPLSRINDEDLCHNIAGTQNSKCQLAGRITLNMWTVMRKEVTLLQYSYENCHFHVLHERIPNFSFEKLTQLYSNHLNHYDRRRVIDYYLKRTVGSLRMLDKVDFIGNTSELARLFGIQFIDVFNRGTQFRVESIMLRHCRHVDYLPVSPSHRQVAAQKAPEILPLVLEPESKYYCDPVVVLDFQSLYPSMMIAYNYCYSTCLGKVDELIRDTDCIDLGCFTIETNKELLIKYRNDIHISPNGVVFLKSNIRKGILPKMLEEILETRVMVKTAMKNNNKNEIPNKALNRKLDARQLGLKLISNVTYGYTSASFSGRMPCVDIADSIVAKGRETLERAINLVNSHTEDWGGRVVYGDTDSLFIHFPGMSKEEAFVRGQHIAEVITAQNPKPVRLKFEKVYLPCVLETKKRYVGFSWESVDQQNPIFDAKGIETVRRDSCPAVAKMLEKSLRLLFKTNDVKDVKEYLGRQFQKILNGRISLIEDFVFAREYRGADNYSERSRVPSKEIAKRRLAADPLNEPKVKERVPYVVVAGAPNDPIFKLVKEPLQLIKDPSLRLNSQYYIERVIIPALNRVFQLMGYNVNDWYREMPKKVRLNRYQYLLGRQSKTERKTITHYFNTTQCCVCEENSKGNDFCDKCRPQRHQCAAAVGDQIRDIELKYGQVLDACRKCTASRGVDIECLSIECPNLFRLHQSRLDLMNSKYLSEVMQKHF